MDCVACGAAASEHASYCPNCGRPLAAAAVPPSPRDGLTGGLPDEWFREAATGEHPRIDVRRDDRPAMVDTATGQPPAPPQRRRRERPVAVATALLALIPVAAVGYTAWLWSSQQPLAGSSANSTRRAHPGPSAAPGGTPIQARGRTLTATSGSSGGPPAGVDSQATSCSASVWAGSRTSCQFAQEVSKQVETTADSDKAGASFTVTAASPVTKQTYAMTCTREGAVLICRGGNNAEVYLTSS